MAVVPAITREELLTKLEEIKNHILKAFDENRDFLFGCDDFTNDEVGKLKTWFFEIHQEKANG